MNNPAAITALLLASAAASAAALAAPLYEPHPCPAPVAVTAAVQCGTAILPENRTTNTGKVRIPIVQLGSGSPSSTPAVVLGGGGPGGGLYLDEDFSLHFWDAYRQNILGKDGTLILIDQRGAGQAQPLLNCPAEKPLFEQLMQQPLPLQQETQKYIAVLRRCLQRLRADGVQVRAYTTAAAADDAEDIRQLLGIEQWHLIGFSYGTRLALEVLRRHPQGVASAVLDSPLPYDARAIPPAYPFAAALRRITEQCRQQPPCRRHGDVQDNIAKALARAGRTALTLQVRHNSVPHTLSLPPHRLLDLLHFGMYDDTGTAALPFFSRQLAQGDTDNENARYFAHIYLDFYLDENWASMLNFFINCREEPLPPQTPPRTMMEQHAHTLLLQYQRICTALWAQAPPPPPAPVSTDLPVLVISGIYDPTTPASWGRALARRLPNARHLTAAASHTPSIALPCLQRGMASFFRSPSATIAAHCGDENLSFY